MSKRFFVAVALLAAALSANAQETQFKWYGFIRNYAVADSRESVYGTEDFFYYLPKDRKVVDGHDLNSQRTFAFAAITSRLGLDVSGYQIEGWKVGAKLEADFYAGVSGVTGTALFRLRQAYMTLGKNAVSFKIGQAWHPMAADMPHVFSLNTGAPFGPFSRTPQATMDLKLSNELTLTASALWQMQYTSAGPNGASADYIKYAGTPEVYVGLGYKANGFAAKAGVDVLSIKPRHDDGYSKLSDRITTVSPFLYAEYSKGLFAVKAKTIFAQAGEHMNLNGGYGVCGFNADGSREYTPTRNSSSWISFSYGKKAQVVLFGGYVRNFGTAKDLEDKAYFYFSKNSFSNMNRMFRVSPEFIYNLGKVAFGLEYELTGVQYGTFGARDLRGLATENLHWVCNHRIQLMAKYTF